MMSFFFKRTSFIGLTFTWGMMYLFFEMVNSQKTCEPKRNCLPPDCRCNSEGSPANISVKETPQMVIFTFDDAVRRQDYAWYRRLFASDRVNPNGCPICMTLFLQDKYTNYDAVRQLNGYGMEIAVHSVTHRLPGRFWKHISRAQFIEEACGQKQNIHQKAGVPLDQIRGWRSPYLQPSGETQYSVLQACNFTYDSTLTIPKSDMNTENPWPFTLDFGWPLQCGVPPCPAESYSGFWVFPIISLITPENYPAVYVDSHRPNSARESFQFLWNNFQSYYTKNRSPFMINMHTAWFYFPQNLEGMDQFIQKLLTLPDVYIVTMQQALDWMKNPVSLSNISQLTSWQCSEPKSAPRPTEKTTQYPTTSTTRVPKTTTSREISTTATTTKVTSTTTTTTPRVTSATMTTTQKGYSTTVTITSQATSTTMRTTPQAISTTLPTIPEVIPTTVITTPQAISTPMTTTPQSISTPVTTTPQAISTSVTTTSQVISTPVTTTPQDISTPVTTTPHLTSTRISPAPDVKPTYMPPETPRIVTTQRRLNATTSAISPPSIATSTTVDPSEKPSWESSTETSQTTQTIRVPSALTPTTEAGGLSTPKASESTTWRTEKPTTTATVHTTTPQPELRTSITTTSMLVTKLIDHDKKEEEPTIYDDVGSGSALLILDLWLSFLVTCSVFAM